MGADIIYKSHSSNNTDKNKVYFRIICILSLVLNAFIVNHINAKNVKKFYILIINR